MAAEPGFAKGLADVAGTQCDSQRGGGKQDFRTEGFYCPCSAHGIWTLYGNGKPNQLCGAALILEIAKAGSVQMRLFQDFLEEMNPLCVPDIHKRESV